MPQHRYVAIAGQRRAVARIIVYPGYLASAAQSKRLFKHSKSEDAAAWMAQYASVHAKLHDLALLELARPAEDVKPVQLH